jgi:phage terminase small subunit
LPMSNDVTPMSANPKPTRPGRRRKGKRGVPNTLQEPLPVVDGTEWGECMAALASDRHRAFVLALYQIKPGYGAHVKAAKLAGWGTSTTSAKSWSVIATRLAHDPKILAAIHEEDQKRIRASAPRAIRALEHLIEDPTHREHGRAIGMVLDRVHGVEQRHVVDVHHHVDHDAEAVAELRMLKSLDVAQEKLIEVFGLTGLPRYERLLAVEDARKAPRVIEGNVIELKQEPK